MNNIIIKKDGLYTSVYNDNLKTSELNKIDNPIAYYLNHNVEIDDNVTVKDLMNLLMEYESDVDLLFMGYSRGFKIRQFFSEMQKPLSESEFVNEIDYLEIYWSTDYYKFKNEAPELSIFPSMHGIGKEKSDEGIQYYGISLTPLNELKNLNIKLNDSLIIEEHIIPEIYEEKPMEIKELINAVKPLTLGEMIGGFIHEITWHGYPKDKEERVEELNQAVMDIKEGKEETIPIEKFFLEVEENNLKEAMDEEDYEEVEKIQKKIEYLKDKLNNK